MKIFSDHHCYLLFLKNLLKQDKNLKRTSGHVQAFLQRMGLTGGKCLLSHQISTLSRTWHKLKEFICREIKPRSKEELIEGNQKFYKTVDKDKCIQYVHYLHKISSVHMHIPFSNNDSTSCLLLGTSDVWLK